MTTRRNVLGAALVALAAKVPVLGKAMGRRAVGENPDVPAEYAARLRQMEGACYLKAIRFDNAMKELRVAYERVTHAAFNAWNKSDTPVERHTARCQLETEIIDFSARMVRMSEGRPLPRDLQPGWSMRVQPD